MKNNFKENLHQKIIDDISINAMSELQNQLSNEAAYCNANIYDAVRALQVEHLQLTPSRKNLSRQSSQFDYGLALNVFMQKFILENKQEIENMRYEYIEKQRAELGISETVNPNYYIAKDKCYYSFENDRFIKQTHIINVAENGDYTTKENVVNSNYYVIKLFSRDDSIKQVCIVDSNNKKIGRLSEVIRLLELKKEVVRKVKRIGYCGKSFDTIADILNTFCAPTESGYYSDNKYNFYKWDYKNSRLIRQVREGLTPGSPSISDYEHKDSRTIIRTDYNGVGLGLQFA